MITFYIAVRILTATFMNLVNLLEKNHCDILIRIYRESGEFIGEKDSDYTFSYRSISRTGN